MKKAIIKNPLITEKATKLSESGRYIFLVAPQATRPEIKKAVKEAYRVDAIKVNVVNVKSKARRLGRTLGRKPGYKKAIVTLKSGQKLDILPQ